MPCRRLAPSRDEESTVLRSAGAAISQLLARVQAESAIRRSEARYRALVAGVPDLLVRVDQAGRVLDWRPGNQTGFRPAATTVGLPLAEVAPEVADALRTAEARGGSPHRTTVVAVEAVATTTPRSLEVRITTAGGESIILVRDVTEQRRLQTSLLHAANHDALTGLANRRLFATSSRAPSGTRRRSHGDDHHRRALHRPRRLQGAERLARPRRRRPRPHRPGRAVARERPPG
jgi:PAS domain-containing protein